MNTETIPLIIIAGPTAVGKTALSIDLAKNFNGEIINGDSLQVYKGLDIGTAKITEEEKEGIVHHLIDILNPNQTYNASQFQKDANKLIIDIYSRGKLPIIVGGTGLYLEGLLYNLEFGFQSDQDNSIRLELEALARLIGDQSLWNVLNGKDPEAAKKIPYQNVRRTIRALEVIEKTGEKFSTQSAHEEKISVYDECLIILDRDREELYNRINQRVHFMLDEGLEDEARTLYEQAAGNDWQSIKGIGYKEWWPYFEGSMTKEDVISTIQQNSRRYAKRQLTWFRNRMKNPQWIDVSNDSDSLNKAKQIVTTHLNIEKGLRENNDRN